MPLAQIMNSFIAGYIVVTKKRESVPMAAILHHIV
jgi:hypothetical protein